MLDKYGFDNHITRLDNAGLLYHVIAGSPTSTCTRDAVPNEAMGYIFEELLRKFSEMSNETAGEHFTPREVIRLMVNILFSEDDDALRGSAPVRTMYDPALRHRRHAHRRPGPPRRTQPDAPPGGVRPGTQPRDLGHRPVRPDDQGPGPDPDRLGNSFTDDEFTGQRFDYMLANPPFGVDWKRIQTQIKDEPSTSATRGRFGAGLPAGLRRRPPVPAAHDQQDEARRRRRQSHRHRLLRQPPVLRRAQVAARARSAAGSSRTTGSKPSSPCRTSCSTTPASPPTSGSSPTARTHDREGKVVLLDAREQWAKMRKSLGDKRKYITDDQIAEITRLYHDALDDCDGHDERVKVFDNEDFGYQRITVERPLRRRWDVTDETITTSPPASRRWPCANATQGTRRPRHSAVQRGEHDRSTYSSSALTDLRDTARTPETAFTSSSSTPAAKPDHHPADPQEGRPRRRRVADPDALWSPTAKVNPLPDPDLRDNENVPLAEDIETTWTRGSAARPRRLGRPRPKPRSATRSRSPATSTNTSHRALSPNRRRD